MTVNGNKVYIGNDSLTIVDPWVLLKGLGSGILPEGPESEFQLKVPRSGFLSEGPRSGVLYKCLSSVVLPEGSWSYFSGMPKSMG